MVPIWLENLGGLHQCKFNGNLSETASGCQESDPRCQKLARGVVVMQDSRITAPQIQVIKIREVKSVNHTKRVPKRVHTCCQTQGKSRTVASTGSVRRMGRGIPKASKTRATMKCTNVSLPTGYGLLIPFILKWSKLTGLGASHGSLVLKAMWPTSKQETHCLYQKGTGCNPHSELEDSLIETQTKGFFWNQWERKSQAQGLDCTI